jgi:hypothetical protein
LGCVLERDELAAARQRDRIIKWRFQPVVALREEISALLRERKISARRMQGHIAAVDRGLHRCSIVFDASAGAQELPVDSPDLQSAGVVRFELVCDLEQLLDRGVDVGQRPFFLEFIDAPVPPR